MRLERTDGTSLTASFNLIKRELCQQKVMATVTGNKNLK